MDDLKKKGSATTSSCIHVIEVNLSTSDSWVLDTDFGSHICTNVQGLKRSRILAKGEVDLWVGNGVRVTALVVRSYDITLPSGLVLSLKNCYYVPTMSRNIISISCLDKIGFEFIIRNNKCSIYYDDVFYGYTPRTHGLYVLDIEDTNEKSIYNINTKKFKSNDLNTTYLWHCRLGHKNENACRNSINMDFWILLILNHLKYVNLVYWEKWLRHPSLDTVRELMTYWA